MSLADALEVPQTFGIARNRIVLIFADGPGIATQLTGAREDDAEGARRDVAVREVGSGDCVIATSASGSTRYTLAGLVAARAAGAKTIAIAGNPRARLLEAAHVGILLDAGPEVIAGSTRLGAGTAQKATLNMLSTLIGVKLGHVHDGFMVNVVADNEKLRGRARRMIDSITGTGPDRAAAALQAAQGSVKRAVLIAAGAPDLSAAEALLSRSEGNLRRALECLAQAEDLNGHEPEETVRRGQRE